MRSPRASDNAQVSNEELENAAAEIERLTSENENLAVRLADEEAARTELEIKLASSEERCLMIEQDVREECWAEMEEQMEEERKRWQSAWDDQVSCANSVYCQTSVNRYRSVITMSMWIRKLN